MSKLDELRCICKGGDDINPLCKSPIHPPKEERQPLVTISGYVNPNTGVPTLLTVASLRQALSKLPAGFEEVLVLCGGKPAHTVTLNLSNPDEPNLDIKFYTLGVL